MKLKRYIMAAICAGAGAMCAGARDDWYDPALKVTGLTAVGAVEPHAAGATVHVRIKAGEWSLCWQSDAGPCRATLTMPEGDRGDDLYVSAATLTVETGAGTDRYRVDGDVSPDGYNSLKIDYDGMKATLIVGDAEAREVAQVPFGAGDVVADIRGTGSCRRMQLIQRQAGAVTETADGDIMTMLRRVSESHDHNEGVWEYFGKDADPGKVTLGGRYVLATVADGDGGYDIVYLAGAETDAGRWQPMKVKGHILPTIFDGDYDLEWYDTTGVRVDGDTYARMSEDRSLLTLGFPMQGATLRFRRVRQSDVIRKAGL